MAQPVLSVRHLTVGVGHEEGPVLVKQVNFDVAANRVVSLVGGSGSGKTTIGLSILRLLPSALKIRSGQILFKDQNLVTMDEEILRTLRGQEIAMVFQEPLYAFNPVMTIGYQIEEVLAVHTDLDRVQRKQRILELLDLVGMQDPVRIVKTYPHQLSGGMRQRAMIAQAIAANPSLIIADEPTSNLDVTLQAKILALFKSLVTQMNLSVLMITHDMGVVKHFSDEVVVLSKGEVVEKGETVEVTLHPRKTYTKQLMKAAKG